MTTSLRDQLLQAGLANKKQSKDAERKLAKEQRERQQLPKDQRSAASRGQLDAQQAQAAKAARDQELNRQSAEKAERKARQAQVAQLIEQHRLPKPQTDERYNFVDGKKLGHVPADRALRDRITRGEVAIVRRAGSYELVPSEVAARIRERDEHAVVACGAADQAADSDGVPDDLIW